MAMTDVVRLMRLTDAERQFALGADDGSDSESWGDPWLDEHVGPAVAGGIYVVGARPGTGKSFMALRILLASPKPSLYVSLEDPVPEVGRRATAASDDPDRKRRVLLACPTMPTLGAATAAIRQAHQHHGVRLAAVDYLQAMRDDSGISAFSKRDQIGNMLGILSALMRELGMSLLLLSQMTRPVQGADEDTRGTIFSMRDSSDIENAATAVLLLHKTGPGKMDMTLGKAKSRPEGARQKFVRGSGGALLPADSVAGPVDPFDA